MCSDKNLLLLLYKIINILFNKLYLNFYKILLKGYSVIGGIKRCIRVNFGEENRARGGTVREVAQSPT